MKKLCLMIIFLLQTLIYFTWADNLPGFSYNHTLNDINSFSSFFPRTENSIGEKSAADYIVNRLKEKNINYTRYELSQSETVNSWSVTIDAVLPGKSGNEIFMIFPLNHPENATPGRDGSAILAAALGLAEELQSVNLPQKVHVVFMGAEYGRGPSYPIGTKDYLSKFYPDFNSAFFYVDLDYIPDNLLINYSGTGVITPMWLLKKSITAANRSGLTYSTQPGINLVNRLRLTYEPLIIDDYFANGYPVIHFEGNYSGFYIPDKEKLYSFMSFLMELASGSTIPSSLQWDSHYLFINITDTELFITEANYVMVLLLVLSLIIVYPFIAQNRFKKYRNTIIHHFWNIPVIFFVMFLLLWISTILLHVVFKIQSFPSLWEISPFHFLVMKLSFTVLLFLLTLRLFKGIHFSRRGTFYSAAAMIFIIFDFLFLMILDIAFTYYLLPMMIFTFLFTIFKNKWVKLIFLILSAGVLLGGTINLFYLDARRVIGLFLISPITGNLIIAANLLPVTLMIFRLQFLFHHRNRKRATMLVLTGDLALAAVSIGLFIYLSTFNPYGIDNVQPVDITETITIDNNLREITFTSPSPLGRLDYQAEDISASQDIAGTSYTVQSGIPYNLPEFTLTSNSFLNRNRYIVKIDSLEDPGKIVAVLTGKEEILIYDSNYPSIDIDDSSIEFLIGANPAFPHTISFTLPADFSGELSLDLKFTDYPSMIKIDSDHFIIDHIVSIRKIISIGQKL